MISSPINETPSSPSQRYIVMIANWKLHICSGLAVLEILFGLITAISILPSCVVSGILQVYVRITSIRSIRSNRIVLIIVFFFFFYFLSCTAYADSVSWRSNLRHSSLRSCLNWNRWQPFLKIVQLGKSVLRSAFFFSFRGWLDALAFCLCWAKLPVSLISDKLLSHFFFISK